MKAKDEPDARVRGIVAALSLNRGEIDPAVLERLLGVLEANAAPPVPAKT